MKLSKYRLENTMKTDALTKTLLALIALGLFLNVISTSNASDCASRTDLYQAVKDIKSAILLYSS